jgi:hypothetical protein
MSALDGLLRNLLDQASENLDEVAKYSVLNHHAQGFDYLNLHYTPAYSVKMYMNRPGEVQSCGTVDYLVNPHDHGYNFNSIVLKGVVKNINFYDANIGREYFQYKYDWRDKSMKPAGCRTFTAESIEYSKGDNYYLTHDVIHTISIDPDEEMLLLLFQFKNVPKGPTNLFLPTPELPSLKDLYKRPTIDDARELIRRAYRRGLGVTV